MYCKDDHDVLEKSALTHLTSIEHNNNNIPMLNNNNNTIMNNNTNHSTTSLSNNNHSSELGSMSGKVIAFFVHFYLLINFKI